MDEQQFETMQTASEQSSGLGVAVMLIIELAIVAFLIAALWRLFSKAGKPGWAAIVPIYNLIVLLEIVGRPLWWFVLMLIPCVNIVVIFLVYIDLAKAYGKGTGFGIGMIFLPFIFLPILGFGDAEYQGAPNRA